MYEVCTYVCTYSVHAYRSITPPFIVVPPHRLLLTSARHPTIVCSTSAFHLFHLFLIGAHSNTSMYIYIPRGATLGTLREPVHMYIHTRTDSGGPILHPLPCQADPCRIRLSLPPQRTQPEHPPATSSHHQSIISSPSAARVLLWAPGVLAMQASFAASSPLDCRHVHKNPPRRAGILRQQDPLALLAS